MKGFSFFEVDKKSEPDVLKAFNGNVSHSGRRVVVDISRPESAVDRYKESSFKGKRSEGKSRDWDEKGKKNFKKKGNSDFKNKGKKTKKKHRGQ